MPNISSPASNGAPTTLLATHHLEEVPPTVTHAALVRDGRITDAGPVEMILADGPMSGCYGIDVVVERCDGRWWARAR